ncbi:pitrilysin family protein [Acrocarpospora sp. B8E8]|uniref:M16 family metallopeptidase n=1 Tax=Acrocarpospora sp. B8E8 TaxID=3153572 RepID=UPI00325C6999
MTLTAPQVLPAPPWRPAPGQQHVLDNGLSVIVHPLPGQSMARVVLNLGIPVSAETTDLDGIAAVMAACLLQGSGDLGATEFADAVAELGATVATTVDHTGPRLVCDVPAYRLGPALELLASALIHPRFALTEVTRQIQIAIGEASREDDSPAGRAHRMMFSLLYGQHERISRPAAGSRTSLERLMKIPHIVSAFHGTHLTPRRVTVVVAGDVVPATVRQLVAEAFGDWTATAVRADYRSGPPRPLETPGRVLLHRAGMPQAYLLLAQPTIGIAHPDWPAVRLAAGIMGVPATGRLDARIRETQGVTYGLRATPEPLLADAGIFTVSGAVAVDKTVDVLQSVRDILLDASTAGFTDAETRQVRAMAAASTRLGHETAAQVADRSSQHAAYGLSPGTFGDDAAAAADTTTADIQAAYRAHLDPSRLAALVVVGDADILFDELVDHELVGPLRVESS